MPNCVVANTHFPRFIIITTTYTQYKRGSSESTRPARTSLRATHRLHGAAASREESAGGVFPREGGKERSEEAAQEGAALGEDCTWSCCLRRCSATSSVSVQFREVEPVEALLASKARQLGDGGAPCNCRYLQAHRPEPDTLVGHSSRAGLALERAVFTSDSARARLPNELRPGTAGRGGFAFSGVTASAASLAVGGDV